MREVDHIEEAYRKVQNLAKKSRQAAQEYDDAVGEYLKLIEVNRVGFRDGARSNE